MEGVLGLVSVFIAAAILLFVGTIVLGNPSLGQCTTLQGYNSTHPASSTGWGKQCVDLGAQSQSSYSLLGLILVVIAAVAILLVVRLM